MNRVSEESRKAWTEFFFGLGLNGVFYILCALLLWPLGKAILAAHLAKGYGWFMVVIALVCVADLVISRVFRIEDDPPSNAFVILSLTLSGALQLGWAAFVALAVAGLVPGTVWWSVAALHVTGVLASFLGTVAVGAFYSGRIYKMAIAVLAFVGYIAFAVWPGAGRTTFGWAFI